MIFLYGICGTCRGNSMSMSVSNSEMECSTSRWNVYTIGFMADSQDSWRFWKGTDAIVDLPD